MSEEAKVIDVDTALKQLEALVRQVADTNDRRYQLVVQMLEDLHREVEELKRSVIDIQTEALARASAYIVRSLLASMPRAKGEEK